MASCERGHLQHDQISLLSSASSTSTWLADGSCISTSLVSSLGARPQLIPRPWRRVRGTGPASPVFSSIWTMLNFLFFAGSRSSLMAQNPSALFSHALVLTLPSASYVVGFACVGEGDTACPYHFLFFLHFDIIGLGWISWAWGLMFVGPADRWSLRDRSRRPEGGEWEPIKISTEIDPSSYIPKITQAHKRSDQCLE